jgi:hypothetical protein
MDEREFEEFVIVDDFDLPKEFLGETVPDSCHVLSTLPSLETSTEQQKSGTLPEVKPPEENKPTEIIPIEVKPIEENKQPEEKPIEENKQLEIKILEKDKQSEENKQTEIKILEETKPTETKNQIDMSITKSETFSDNPTSTKLEISIAKSDIEMLAEKPITASMAISSVTESNNSNFMVDEHKVESPRAEQPTIDLQKSIPLIDEAKINKLLAYDVMSPPKFTPMIVMKHKKNQQPIIYKNRFTKYFWLFCEEVKFGLKELHSILKELTSHDSPLQPIFIVNHY